MMAENAHGGTTSPVTQIPTVKMCRSRTERPRGRPSGPSRELTLFLVERRCHLSRRFDAVGLFYGFSLTDRARSVTTVSCRSLSVSVCGGVV